MVQKTLGFPKVEADYFREALPWCLHKWQMDRKASLYKTAIHNGAQRCEIVFLAFKNGNNARFGFFLSRIQTLPYFKVPNIKWML